MSKPETLEILLDEARKYAEFSMRNIGHVPPTMLAVAPEGMLTFLPDEFADATDKITFVNTGRLISIGYGATAIVMILESWVTFAKDGQPLDDTPPSEAMDRKEFVILMGESIGKKAPLLLPKLFRDYALDAIWISCILLS